MNSPFDSFVIFAEMRTGSNFLEANLNEFEGITSYGELFNPHFLGQLNRDELFGFSLAQRDADPLPLLAALRDAPGMCGFRFFHDHDPRVLAQILPDPACAKVILTRNPVDSYVSRKIAAATDQWRLTNITRKKAAQAVFDGAEFEAHVTALQEFQLRLLHGLQTTGQTAFYIAYEDLNDVEVLNGLARWLGLEARIDAPSRGLKKQNPEPMLDKVANPEVVTEALARLDRFNLTRTPNFEPRRGPMVPGYLAAARAPLLYMPVRSGPEAQVQAWMAALDGVETTALQGSFTQKTLRQWQRAAPGHRSFTVLRHPLARAYAAFSANILSGRFDEICETLRRVHGIALPDPDAPDDFGPDAERQAFLGFLQFLKANLAGQTRVRVDASWASQMAVLQGFAQFTLPDHILREETLAAELAALAGQLGHQPPPAPAPEGFARLAAIYDKELENAARGAYGRDYLSFGFGDWQPPAE